MHLMDILAKKVTKKIKEYEEKTKARHNKQMMNKINQVMGEVKRELNFTSWYSKPIEKPQVGPLEIIKVHPDVTNVQAETTYKVQV